MAVSAWRGFALAALVLLPPGCRARCGRVLPAQWQLGDVVESIAALAGLTLILASLGAYEATAVVILSDHGFRFGGKEHDPFHIPFIVKLAGRQKRVDVTSASGGERLLKEIVERSCAGYGAG